MKEFIVLLDIETPSMSARQFREKFGVEPDHFRMRKIGKRLLWRTESKLAAKSALKNHIKSVLERSPINVQPTKQRNRCRCKSYFNVGMMVDAYTCMVDLPIESIKLLGRHGVGIAVSCYPTDFGRNGG